MYLYVCTQCESNIYVKKYIISVLSSRFSVITEKDVIEVSQNIVCFYVALLEWTHRI